MWSAIAKGPLDKSEVPIHGPGAELGSGGEFELLQCRSPQNSELAELRLRFRFAHARFAAEWRGGFVEMFDVGEVVVMVPVA